MFTQLQIPIIVEEIGIHVMLLHRFRAASGFTLIELLIVVIVVGILMSVALPLYHGATTRAYLAEADAALGSIRRRMREVLLFQTPATDWAVLAEKYDADLALKITDIPELLINPSDLSGRYFDHHAYRLEELTATTFTVYCIGDSSKTANKEAVEELIRSIDHTGTLSTVVGQRQRGRSEEHRRDDEHR